MRFKCIWYTKSSTVFWKTLLMFFQAVVVVVVVMAIFVAYGTNCDGVVFYLMFL